MIRGRGFACEDYEEEQFKLRLAETNYVKHRFGVLIAGFQSSSMLAVNGT